MRMVRLASGRAFADGTYRRQRRKGRCWSRGMRGISINRRIKRGTSVALCLRRRRDPDPAPNVLSLISSGAPPIMLAYLLLTIVRYDPFPSATDVLFRASLSPPTRLYCRPLQRPMLICIIS